jgi:hypothetical protein
MADTMPVIKLGAFSFDTSNDISSLLFYSFNASADVLNQAAQTMNLNLDVYNGVRDQVKQKLGSKVTDLVSRLDAAPPPGS